MHLFDLPIKLLAFIVSFLEHECDLNAFSQVKHGNFMKPRVDEGLRGSPTRSLARVEGRVRVATVESDPREARVEGLGEAYSQANKRPYQLPNRAVYDLDVKGRRPVTVAAMDGHEDLVRLFLERGVDYNNEVPLISAAEKGYKYIVEILLEHRIVVDQDTLCIAAEAGNLDISQLLAESCSEPVFMDAALDALCAAAVAGHTGVVQYLLDKGADPNSVCLILAMPSFKMLVCMVILRSQCLCLKMGRKLVQQTACHGA